jgi:hypothetical protein
MSRRKQRAQIIHAQLQKILSSATFRRVPNQRAFLQFVVEAKLSGRESDLKLSYIAAELFNHDDGKVRLAATNTRSKLAVYYQREGKADPIQIDILVGNYVPEFSERSAGTPIGSLSRQSDSPELGRAVPTPIPFQQIPARKPATAAKRETDPSVVGEGLSSPLIADGHSEAATTRFANAFNAGSCRINGSVIETHAHPNLESCLPLSETGWSESQVSLRLRPGSFATEPLLSDPLVAHVLEQREAESRRDGRASILTPPDGVKYAVVDASSPFLDVSDFNVTVQETRYFSIMRARPAVERSLQLRMKFGHVDPYKNRIPHALGLQFIALFSDKQVLAIQRAKDTFPFPGTWSFSGEEQCAPIDLSWDKKDRMKNYMLRTVVEEVFPLARIPDPVRLAPVMEEVQRYVADMRIVSLLLEEPIVTFSFFVIFRLKGNVKEYANEVIHLVRSGRGQMSKEGLYFSVALSDLPLLLEGQNIRARPIFGDGGEGIAASNLHPTSRYRLMRSLNILATLG